MFKVLSLNSNATAYGINNNSSFYYIVITAYDLTLISLMD